MLGELAVSVAGLIGLVIVLISEYAHIQGVSGYVVVFLAVLTLVGGFIF